MSNAANNTVKSVFKTTSSKGVPSFSTEVEAGEEIFHEGDLGIEMFIIQEGQVEIIKEHEEQEQKLAVLDKGDFFGEMSILEDMPRTATARALTECKLLQINGSTFDQMLRRNPEIAVRMMRKLSRRLRDTDRMLREALGESGAGRAPEMPVPDEKRAGTAPEKLVHEDSGTEFRLVQDGETTIGRSDPVTGIRPDIDLTPVDSQRSISRRHSKIVREGEQFFLREEIGTMNGTFVNGQRIATGEQLEFEPGDELRFGLVKTVFRAS